MNAIDFLRSHGGFYFVDEIINGGIIPRPDVLATLRKAEEDGKLDHRIYEGRDQWRIHSTKPIGPRGKTDKWTRESIVVAIQAFNRREGRPPVRDDFLSSNGLPGPKLIYKQFRSVAHAVAEAGIEPRQGRAA